ncbi:hypothetical protein [Terrabacter carboxydivorans]|uniref:Uncharacterized protein n=1 Tax=Terrabacter carboxydivorans TaxID=619730 RepID=A0ABN3M8L1_9MICO
MESVLPYVLAIVPTVGVGTLFYFVIKSILEGDRRERLAQAQWEAQHGGHAGSARRAETVPTQPDGTTPTGTTPTGMSQNGTTPQAPTKER